MVRAKYYQIREVSFSLLGIKFEWEHQGFMNKWTSAAGKGDKNGPGASLGDLHLFINASFQEPLSKG
jgi:hypothetical protein